MLYLRFSLIGLLFAATLANATNEALSIDLEKRALQYFIDNAHPQSGLVLDRVSKVLPRPATNRVASLAATGYALAVIANAAQRGLVSPAFAEAYARKTLTFVRDHVSSFHGFYLHWLDWETGAIQWESDYSTIDTALFVAGALYAATVFPGTEVARLAAQFYGEMDFYPMMTDGGVEPNRRTLSLSYSADTGYSHWQWSIYAENMILYVLALGSPTHALPAESWTAFDRGWGDIGEATPLLGYDMPLFIHQYSQLFLDLRQFDDGQPNYFTNSVRATAFNRGLALSEHRKTYQAGFWGLSAGDAPNANHYVVAGPGKHGSAACIACVLGSAMFARDLVLKDVERWLSGPYAANILDRYGLVDSVDLDVPGGQDWFSQEFLAITVGTAYLSLANSDGGPSVWTDFMKIPAIQRGLMRAKSVPPRFWQPPKATP